MYLEHFKLDHSPFQEEPDLNVFFVGGDREEISKLLISDLLAGKPFVKLIGNEGLGKTLICRFLQEHLPTGTDVIYLDNPVGSFDDLLRIICLDLGMDPGLKRESVNFLSELRQLLEQRSLKGRKVYLIIDEAEKLFLAALERLVRTICDSDEAGTLRIVLAGRPGLDANLEQLSIYCSNVDLSAGYYLEPLSEDDTLGYLTFRLNSAGLVGEEHGSVFSDEAVAKIYQSSMGNPRMINILAEESLQRSCTEKSFMVLLDHVATEPAGELRDTARLAGYYDLLLENKLIAGAIAASAFLLLMIIVLLSGGDPDGQKIAEGEKKVEIPILLENQEEQDTPLVEITAPADTIETVEEAGEIENSDLPDPQSTAAAITPPVEQPQVTPEPISEPAPEPEVVEQLPVESDPVEESQVVEPLDTPVEPATAEIPEHTELEVLRPGKIKRRVEELDSPAPKPAVSELVVEEEPKVVFVEQDAGNNKGRDGDKIYRERLGASASWLAGAYRGKYTIQLMMLTSDTGKTNIKKMMVQDKFYKEVDNLYILRKKTSPPTMFVFYGNYDSMEMARKARNNLPLFLRKHHPYALSISDALKKTED